MQTNPIGRKGFCMVSQKSLCERVQSRIKDKYDGIIPYDFLTYGELINFISQEALSLCSLIRINAKIKQQFKK